MNKQIDDNGITELSLDELENCSQHIYGGYGTLEFVTIAAGGATIISTAVTIWLAFCRSSAPQTISFTQSTRNFLQNFGRDSVTAMMGAASTAAASVSSQASSLFFDAQQSNTLSTTVSFGSQGAEVYVNAV